MNFIEVISLLLAISYIHSEYNDCETTEISYKEDGQEYTRNNTFVPSSADDCKNRKVLEYHTYYDNKGEPIKIKTYKTRCCYYTYEGMEEDTKYRDYNLNSDGKEVGYGSSCIELTDSQYDNIQNYVNYIQFGDDRNGVKIDCNSYYLQFGLLSLILLIIF